LIEKVEGSFSWRFLLLFLVLALGLRLMLLGSKSLWLDEADSLRIAQAGQGALWAGLSDTNSPPLFYWLLAGWARPGQSEFVLRFPGAVAGSLAVVLVYVLGKDLVDRPVALSAAGLVAVSPLLVWYSQELRAYTFLSLAGLAVLVCFTKLVLQPKVVWWLGLVAGQVAALYLHYAAILLLPIQIVILYLLRETHRAHRSAVLPWLTGWALSALAFWPWLRTPSFATFPNSAVSGNKYLARLLSERLHVAPELTTLGMPHLIAGLIAGAAALFLLCWLLRRALRAGYLRALRQRERVQAAVIALFLLLLVASVVPRGYILKRQLVLLWPLGLLAFAWFWPWHPRFQRYVLAILACSLIASLVNVVLIPKTQWRQAAQHILEFKQPNDLVLLEPEFNTVPFDYYAQGGIDRAGLPFGVDSSQLDTVVSKYDRIWLVLYRSDADPQQRTQTWLDSHTALVETIDFYGLQVRLYQRSTGAGAARALAALR
jgi:4-amino-4-deoxy-L-arabinose transferase-like glycosyltransferase